MAAELGVILSWKSRQLYLATLKIKILPVLASYKEMVCVIVVMEVIELFGK